LGSRAHGAQSTRERRAGPAYDAVDS